LAKFAKVKIIIPCVFIDFYVFLFSHLVFSICRHGGPHNRRDSLSRICCPNEG